MTSRERVIRALDHVEPDMVPLDMGSTPVTGIQAVVYKKLKEELGIRSGDIYIYDVIQQLAFVEDEVRSELGIDTTTVVPEKMNRWRDGIMSDGNRCKYPAGFNPETLDDGTKVTRDRKGYWGDNDEGAVTLKMPPGGYYYEIPFHPLQQCRTKEEIDDFNWYWELDDETVEYWKESLEAAEKTDLAVVADTVWGGWGQNYEVLQNLRGWDDFLVDLLINPELARYMLEVRLDAVLKRWDMMLGILGNVPQVVCIGDDLGLQEGTQISPDLYRRIIKPVHGKFISFIKERTDAKVFLH